MPAAPPLNFRVTEVPWGKVTLDWDPPLYGGPGTIDHYVVTRDSSIIASNVTVTPWTDLFSFLLNTRYNYGVYAVTCNRSSEPPPCDTIAFYADGQPATLYTFMDKLPTAATASVDSRLDHRKMPVVLRNYRFDYTYSPNADLGDAHRLSFTLNFGPFRGI